MARRGRASGVRSSLLRRMADRLSWLAAAAARTVLIAAATAWFVPAFIVAILAGGAGPAARTLRSYFQRCGGGFVKLGQLLSTRYDLLPSVYCTELSRLLDDAGAVETRRIV